MNMAKISRGIALGLALALPAAPALAATKNDVTPIPSAATNSEWSLEEGNAGGGPRVKMEANKANKKEQVTLSGAGTEEGNGSSTPAEEKQQWGAVQLAPRSGETNAKSVYWGIGSFESLQGALDALQPFSADQVETLAGIAEKLLDAAEKSGMTAETLRQLLTDLQTVPQSRWFGLIAKYKPGQALTAAVLDAMNQIKSMDLGVELSTEEALALADALLKALEGGWTPQWIAHMKSFQDVKVVQATPVKVVQATVLRLKNTDTYLATLAKESGTGSSPKELPVNLNIQALGDGLNPSAMQATIRGGLANNYGKTASYGFAVNLSSGDIRDGFMNGGFGSGSDTFDVSGGSGKVNGNSFALSGFTGSVNTSSGTPANVTSATLNGTASKGFGNLGDIGATGSYNVDATSGYQDSGSITGGQRVK